MLREAQEEASAADTQSWPSLEQGGNAEATSPMALCYGDLYRGIP